MKYDSKTKTMDYDDKELRHVHGGKASPKDNALKKKTRGNYSVFRYDSENHESKTRMKHGLSHSEMHHELKNNPEYRGNDKHGFVGGRTYSRKK